MPVPNSSTASTNVSAIRFFTIPLAPPVLSTTSFGEANTGLFDYGKDSSDSIVWQK